jgi:hypothetical protein
LFFDFIRTQHLARMLPNSRQDILEGAVNLHYTAPSPSTSTFSSPSPNRSRRRASSTTFLLDKMAKGGVGWDSKGDLRSKVSRSSLSTGYQVSELTLVSSHLVRQLVQGRGQRAVALLLFLGACLLLVQQYSNLSLSSPTASWLSDLTAFCSPESSSSPPSNLETLALPGEAVVALSSSREKSTLDELCVTRSCSFLFPVRIGESLPNRSVFPHVSPS